MATPAVLHVAQSSEYGLGAYMLNLVEAQVRAGWSVAVAGDPASWLRPRASATGARWCDWVASRDPGPGVPAEALRLRRIVREVSPDIVHLHSSKAGLVGRLVVRGRMPTVFQPHAWSFFAMEGRKSTLARAWERASARWADVLLCGSEGERSAGEAAGIKAPRWRVIPNAVDTDRFTPGDKREARVRLPLGEE
ncbi:MAG: hypothetical protein QOD30_1397, partial [Actinomycetota bacterium]|nr:hypothetical protein [Actinomycetota bacterium]